jgi:hypothetical protein
MQCRSVSAKQHLRSELDELVLCEFRKLLCAVSVSRGVLRKVEYSYRATT